MPPLFIRYKESLIEYAIQTHDWLITWIIKGELVLYFFLIFEKQNDEKHDEINLRIIYIPNQNLTIYKKLFIISILTYNILFRFVSFLHLNDFLPWFSVFF